VHTVLNSVHTVLNTVHTVLNTVHTVLNTIPQSTFLRLKKYMRVLEDISMRATKM